MEKRIVEIDGVKIEVDMRTAKVIEAYKVGDKVKVLIKSYGDTFDMYPGVIMGFYEFKDLPCIEVAYLRHSDIQLKTLNAVSKDISIAPISEAELIMDRQDVISRLNKDIENKKREALDLECKRDYFLKHFDTYFSDWQAKKLAEQV